ncbi:MAG: hypothetical protein MHPSP_001880 [Paramarteilia canceri]
MAKIYGHHRGKSASTKAFGHNDQPSVFKDVNGKVVQDLVEQMAMKGMSPSMIVQHLRDNYGVLNFKGMPITRCKVLRLLKSKGLAPEIPEDLYNILMKAARMKKHLEQNKNDTSMKFYYTNKLCLAWRYVRYYKRTGVIPANFDIKQNLKQIQL